MMERFEQWVREAPDVVNGRCGLVADFYARDARVKMLEYMTRVIGDVMRLSDAMASAILVRAAALLDAVVRLSADIVFAANNAMKLSVCGSASLLEGALACLLLAESFEGDCSWDVHWLDRIDSAQRRSGVFNDTTSVSLYQQTASLGMRMCKMLDWRVAFPNAFDFAESIFQHYSAETLGAIAGVSERERDSCKAELRSTCRIMYSFVTEMVMCRDAFDALSAPSIGRRALESAIMLMGGHAPPMGPSVIIMLAQTEAPAKERGPATQQQRPSIKCVRVPDVLLPPEHAIKRLRAA
jgi:hypothetical protein